MFLAASTYVIDALPPEVASSFAAVPSRPIRPPPSDAVAPRQLPPPPFGASVSRAIRAVPVVTRAVGRSPMSVPVRRMTIPQQARSPPVQQQAPVSIGQIAKTRSRNTEHKAGFGDVFEFFRVVD